MPGRKHSCNLLNRHCFGSRALPRPHADAVLYCCCCRCCSDGQVADLQVALREEQIIVEEKKAQTDELIVSIGKEKAVVDEAVEAGREDEEAASRLQNEVQAFQEECTKDLAAGVWQGLLFQESAGFAVDVADADSISG